MLIFFLLTLGYKEFFEKKIVFCAFHRFDRVWHYISIIIIARNVLKLQKCTKLKLCFFWTRVLRIFHTTSKEGKEQISLLEIVYTRDSFVWQTKYLKMKNTAQIMAFIKNKGGIIFPRLSVVWLPLLCERYTKIDNL